MTYLIKQQRLRRVALLCCHFSRNLAYRRAGHDRLTKGKYSQVFVTIDGNFLDMAVLEWCKLFGDKNGKHHWGKIVPNQIFKSQLLAQLKQSNDQFEGYIKEMRDYRDKFLAHLDDELVMQIPRLDLAMTAVEILYCHLVHQEALASDLNGLPTDLTAYYEQCSKEAVSFLDLCEL